MIGGRPRNGAGVTYKVRYPRTFLVQGGLGGGSDAWESFAPYKTSHCVVYQSDFFAFQLPPHKLQIRNTVTLANFEETS